MEVTYVYAPERLCPRCEARDVMASCWVLTHVNGNRVTVAWCPRCEWREERTGL